MSAEQVIREPGAEPGITLQFHPDRPHGAGSVIDAMADDGVYLSQFVTGTSNGGLTAAPGGDRWRWESRLFDGRYDDAPPSARPIYGAWNRRADPYGAATRFGSAHLRLRPEVVARATFCFPDSVFEPDHLGDATELDRLCGLADGAGLDLLDDYVESHVHGGVRLDTDVEAVVLDPCFAGTDVESAARRIGCDVEFHPGWRVSPDALDPAYRGAEIVELARSLAEEVTPAVISHAARGGAYDPQDLKKVWHCLARFGRARPPA